MQINLLELKGKFPGQSKYKYQQLPKGREWKVEPKILKKWNKSVAFKLSQYEGQTHGGQETIGVKVSLETE